MCQNFGTPKNDRFLGVPILKHIMVGTNLLLSRSSFFSNRVANLNIGHSVLKP